MVAGRKPLVMVAGRKPLRWALIRPANRNPLLTFYDWLRFSDQLASCFVGPWFGGPCSGVPVLGLCFGFPFQSSCHSGCDRVTLPGIGSASQIGFRSHVRTTNELQSPLHPHPPSRPHTPGPSQSIDCPRLRYRRARPSPSQACV